MNHVILADIFRQYDHQYLSLRAKLDKIPTTERWARGVCDPCRLEPYYIEMLGDKPGRFIKKIGAPGKNMWLCRYDACNALLYKCEFQQRLRSGDWSHSDTFYIYGDDYTLELTYHSAFEDYTKKEISVSLVRLVYAALETGRMIRSFQYFSPDDYSESIYSYEDGKIHRHPLQNPDPVLCRAEFSNHPYKQSRHHHRYYRQNETHPHFPALKIDLLF